MWLSESTKNIICDICRPPMINYLLWHVVCVMYMLRSNTWWTMLYMECIGGAAWTTSMICSWSLFVCWSLTSLCHSNGHIETMPAREINPFTALTRIRSQFLRTQWSTSNHSEWTRLRLRPLSHRGLLYMLMKCLMSHVLLGRRWRCCLNYIDDMRMKCLMSHVLLGRRWRCCLNYFDDILMKCLMSHVLLGRRWRCCLNYIDDMRMKCLMSHVLLGMHCRCCLNYFDDILMKCLMSHVLHGMQWKYCLVYIDEILIVGHEFDSAPAQLYACKQLTYTK